MIRLHVHLVSDSTGETLESVAKACLAQFQDVEAIKHYWPMVRSVGHLDRVMREIAERPGLIVYTLVNGDVRRKLENRAHAMGLPLVSALDPVLDALSQLLGQERSEEHTSELQSLMRNSYAVFCLKKKTAATKSPNSNMNTQGAH